MSKETGLGDNLYVSDYNISCDIGSLSNIHGGNSPLTVTGICKSAYERIGGKRDGGLSFVSYFNTDPEAEHEALSSLPTADRIVSYFRGTAIGNVAASTVAKQVNYDPKRNDDGSFTFTVDVQSNGYGLEFGEQLTPGMRTDTDETDGASLDGSSSSGYGAQAYLHVTDFDGTNVTITIEDSADDSTYNTLVAFAEVDSPTSERISVAGTIDRYVRVTTTGTFNSVTFAVNFVRNEAEVKF